MPVEVEEKEMNEIENCPVCGGSVSYSPILHHKNSDLIEWVGCRKCGICTYEREGAINNWNTFAHTVDESIKPKLVSEHGFPKVLGEYLVWSMNGTKAFIAQWAGFDEDGYWTRQNIIAYLRIPNKLEIPELHKSVGFEEWWNERTKGLDLTPLMKAQARESWKAALQWKEKQ